MSLPITLRVAASLLLASSPLLAQTPLGEIATPEPQTSSRSSATGAGLLDGTSCASYQLGSDPFSRISNSIPFGGGLNRDVETLFARDNGGSVGGAVYFDLTTSEAFRLDTVTLNTLEDGVPISCEILVTDEGGNSTASRSTRGDWRSLGFASGIASGADNRSVLTLDTPQVLSVGSYGIAMVARNFAHAYTNGNGANQAANSAEVQLSLGAASNLPFRGTFFEPRVANVELGYIPLNIANLSSTFASNNNGSTGGANYFDVTSDRFLAINAISVNTAATVGSPLTLAVYTTAAGMSYAGNETDSTVWTRVATARGVSAGLDNESLLTLNQAIQVNQESQIGTTQGFAIVAEDFGFRYTNGNGSNQVVSDSQITLNFGTASNTPFAGPVFDPRVANIRLAYGDLTARINSNSRYQLLIESSRIDQTGLITDLAFAASGSGEYRFDEMTVRMAELPAGSTLRTDFAANLQNPVTVFETRGVFGPVPHVWPVTADTWMPIGMQRPFAYNGGDLLVEVVVRNRDALVNRAGFRSTLSSTTDPTPRLFAEGWIVTPATGQIDNAGLRTRLEFGCGSLSRFGKKCGDLETHVTGDPSLGGSIDIVSGVGASVASTVLHLGFDNSSVFPLTLEAIGAPNCFFHCEAAAAISQISSGLGFTTETLPIPNDPNLNGATPYGQHLQLNSANPGGVSAAGYVRIVLGPSL